MLIPSGGPGCASEGETDRPLIQASGARLITRRICYDVQVVSFTTKSFHIGKEN